MGPWRFPFQMAIDFIFKSVFNDHSNSGFNSAAFLCPWKLRMWRVGKQTRFFDLSQEKQQKIKKFCSKPGDQRSYQSWSHQPGFHIPLPQSGVKGKHTYLFLWWQQETHFMKQSFFLRFCHNNESKSILVLKAELSMLWSAEIYWPAFHQLTHSLCIYHPKQKYNVCSTLRRPKRERG